MTPLNADIHTHKHTHKATIYYTSQQYNDDCQNSKKYLVC